MAVPTQDEVEAFAVSIRLGDSEAEAGCLAHEGQFGQFSQAFAGWWFVVFPGTKFGLLFHGAGKERRWLRLSFSPGSYVRVFLAGRARWIAGKQKGAGYETRA